MKGSKWLQTMAINLMAIKQRFLEIEEQKEKKVRKE